ncbi:NAD-glutamate dehydrogenase [Radicibacter daui]|uniref:NAD-glutamate dehydrogenase n=1 Tax=Radicibacter daui TaxID=3064829 RepID=UPI004046E025
MSLDNRAESRAENQKRDLISAVIERIHTRLGKGKATTAEAFVERFFRNVGADDMAARGAEHLYGAALSLWQLAAQRKAGQHRLKVFTPRTDEHGWRAGHTVIEIVQEDMPFLVDSVTQEMDRRGITVHMVIHPVLEVTRNAKGELTAIADAGDGPRESLMYLEIDEISSEAILADIEQALEGVLGDVRAAVADWQQMRSEALALADRLEKTKLSLPEAEISEACAFLRWAADDSLTFLGYREVDYEADGDVTRPRIIPGSGLGILKDEARLLFDGSRSITPVGDDNGEGRLLEIEKANHRSTVHRGVLLDVVSVERFDEQGKAVGAALFVGLFTSRAYSQSPRLIPYLRRKVAAVEARAGFATQGHARKALAHVLETYPRDELFQISEDDLLRISLGVLRLQDRKRVALFTRHDRYNRFVSCFVYVPRERLDNDLTDTMGDILAEGFGGDISAFAMALDEGVLARLHFVVSLGAGAVSEPDIDEIERQLIEAGKSWSDGLKLALIEARGEEQGLSLFGRYSSAFAAAYTEIHTPDQAVSDIERIEKTLASGHLGMNLYRPLEADESELYFKIYHQSGPVPLATVMPMLVDMGVKVVSTIPYEVELDGGTIWIHDFRMQLPEGANVDLARVREPFHHTFIRVWEGEMESDGFNRLVIGAGLDWRDVTLVRAFAKYLQQARLPYSLALVMDVLSQYPQAAELTCRLFDALLNPGLEGNREDIAQELQHEFDQTLDSVTNLDADTILRRFNNMVRACLRTNFWQPDEKGEPKSYVSFKLDSSQITGLPAPRPWREIFVYSARVEAIHLRGGTVARGGLRWSDRREDFRTEILGLMKAQMVKNAVIVPVGSKGGFVVKRPPAPSEGRDAFMAEGIACYRIFMSGLLDITDNLKAGDIIPPAHVLRRDRDDPYLVVAADKGTATFSDIANAVSESYGFWLGDAFASGGSAGYDHKKMGITARGGWEAVKRHFRELGRNIQEEPFTVVGVGDMSGDVFGNGMLLSRKIELVAAFNHQHIFLDPTPDTERSFNERERLFNLPRSSWADYDRACLSEGGLIIDRSAKSVTLTPQVRERFGFTVDKLAPNDLIRSLLKAQVDLLWFGGIGTYVKHSAESQADAGDKSNDALRVDAGELRAKVIGEGANLGMTQRARIEYALAGGHLNTDAIDNSAGVDCSDHEVNIKILLGDIESRGDITRKQRNNLLVEMTDEVSRLVLRDNYLQTQAISISERYGTAQLDSQARLMRDLEKSGLLNRAIEFLPDEAEISRRAAHNNGLTRPEIAVLLAYSKIWLYDQLLKSALPDDPKMVEDLVLYFPAQLRDRYRERIEGHQLRREIIATAVTNSLINRTGPTFISRLAETTGMAADDIARCYIVARDAFEVRAMWQEIEALDTLVPAEVQLDMLQATEALMERTVAWFLANARHPIAMSEEAENFGAGIARLKVGLETRLSENGLASLIRRRTRLTEKGVPEELAHAIASLPILAASPDVVAIARASGHQVEAVGQIYFAVGDKLGINWLRGAAGEIVSGNHWQKQAVAALIDDLFAQQSAITRRILEDEGAGAAGADAVEAWANGRRRAIDRLNSLIGELQGQPAIDLAMLAVGARALRALTLS